VAQLYPRVLGCSVPSEVEVEVNLRPTISRPVRLGIGPPYGTLDLQTAALYTLPARWEWLDAPR
jgi:hypothetical protein